ncbi:MAG TPA: sigma-70 family RNA polymerase sigma factor [Vicinamibacterales bacterium]|jgi:RNA polymerase sigma factor (TIGR02999 family)|nr:sigma-70 family RNA polymerase sigma factor [Vicinamibacterales bacterium]
MPAEPKGDVTRLLAELNAGNQDALAALVPLVYDELRKLAARYLRRERPDQTLQATALVHEAYLRLVEQRAVQWQNRAHFLGIAAQAMRRILVSRARASNASKRGSGALELPLDGVALVTPQQPVDLVALDAALEHLAGIDAQQSRIVELRFFGGLTVEEVGEVLGLSTSTIKREWRLAKAWLRREMVAPTRPPNQSKR